MAAMIANVTSQRVPLQDRIPVLACSSWYVVTRPPLPVRPLPLAYSKADEGQTGDVKRRQLVILLEVKRLADPYRDLDVIDSRAPRFNQATIGVLTAIAVATGWWWLLGVGAAQLVVGLTLGRRYCLPCLAYFEVVQRIFGEGPLEDSRPPRFANLVGAAFLGSAAGAWWLGAETMGTILGAIVAVLAAVAATTGFCAGCEIYRRTARLRGISPQHH